MSTMLLGIDTGGTFTDFVFYEGQALKVHKVLSTPDCPEQAILQGIDELGLTLEGLAIIHGSTVATNAVLQNRGVKTVYITNRGFADVLTIGRQARKDLFNLQPSSPVIPVAAELCLETGGRMSAQGDTLEPLSEDELNQLLQNLLRLSPQAVAINLLFSYLDDRYERKIADFIMQGFQQSELNTEIFISCSSEVLPEYREYERGMATWLNACTGPLVQHYLNRLKQAVKPALVTVMQSSGGTASIKQAGNQSVRMLLSGPAGGLAGAQFVAAANQLDQLITFDMGGTSTDVALIDKTISLTTNGKIAEWPVAVPMVDMHTIGAGGGSIANIDAGGLLQVGPASAGSVPGPACYGNNSLLATVTDANLVLGRIVANAFLGGHLNLDESAARQAIGRIASQLGTSLMDAAQGIVRVANEHMSAALRVISIQRGLDPRNFTLVSFGGAGGLHVCALAESLAMTKAMIPVYGGVLSALGMLIAPQSRLLSRTINIFPAQSSNAVRQIEVYYEDLLLTASNELFAEGIQKNQLSSELLVDIRYRGQSSCLSLGWNSDMDELQNSFHQRHQQRYGHCLDEEVEIVNIRVQMHGPNVEIELDLCEQVFVKDFTSQEISPKQNGVAKAVTKNLAIIKRADITAGKRISGPILIIEPVATTYIDVGWHCQSQQSGNLLLNYAP